MSARDPDGGDHEMQTCDTCGMSLEPLSNIHTERHCRQCGRMTYVAEPGQNGQGIQVRAGDRVVIPPGAIKLSLDRMKSTGWFTRAGLAWFATMLFHAGAPESSDDISSLLDNYLAECNSVLRHSEALSDLDLDTEAGARAAVERVNMSDHLRGSIEHWALALGSALAEVVESLDSGNAERAAWGMNRATNAHAMLVFKRELELPLWHGYLTEGLRETLQIWQANQNNANEEFWQRTLGERPLVLSQTFATPVVVLKGKAYVGGKGIENSQGKVTDFLMTNRLSDNAALIEIKTPMTKLLGSRYRAGVYPPSSELSGAVVQVEAQKDALLKDFHSLARDSADQFSAFSPHGLIVAGDLQRELIDAARRQSFELFRQGLRDVQIVTFDELFSKIEGLLRSLQGE